MRIINGAITDTYNYLINGVNLRVRKTGPSTVVPSGTQIFVYDDAARLIGEYDNLGRARIEHVWLDERPIAAITYTYTGTSTTPTTTTTSYVETDHLATPRLITNASRQKRWSWDSAPYGDTFANENPQSLGVYVYNLRFPGQYFDKETNHHYNHHRDYESTTGRYVQSDPIGLLGGINTYAYVESNPLGFSDPLGLQTPPRIAPPQSGATSYTVIQVQTLINQIHQYYPQFSHPTFRPTRTSYSRQEIQFYSSVLRDLQQSGICPSGGTYILTEPGTGTVMRTGRTIDRYSRRGDHARDVILGQFRFEIDVRTNSYFQQRGREQIIHDLYGPPFNFREPISPRNPNRQSYLDSTIGIR